jgi:hypothetical protein
MSAPYIIVHNNATSPRIVLFRTQIWMTAGFMIDDRWLHRSRVREVCGEPLTREVLDISEQLAGKFWATNTGP